MFMFVLLTHIESVFGKGNIKFKYKVNEGTYFFYKGDSTDPFLRYDEKHAGDISGIFTFYGCKYSEQEFKRVINLLNFV
jgi:hypothetical protein